MESIEKLNIEIYDIIHKKIGRYIKDVDDVNDRVRIMREVYARIINQVSEGILEISISKRANKK